MSMILLENLATTICPRWLIKRRTISLIANARF
jgi:hypothetical protein